MRDEYHLILIEKLKSALPQKELTDLLNEIAKTQEPIFIEPLQDVYKTYKSSPFSHNIIWTIAQIDSTKKIRFAKNVLKAKETQYKDLQYALEILRNTRYYEQDGINILKNKLPTIIKAKDLLHRNFLVRDVLSYLKDAQRLDIIDTDLPQLYKDRDYNSEIRELSLKYWILNNPTERIEYLSNHYAKFNKDEKLEEHLAKVCTELDYHSAQELRQIILLQGSNNAKNIIEYYQNSIPVKEILLIRDKINSISKSGIIGTTIFTKDENFHKQLKPAANVDEFEGKCNSLRASLKSFNTLLRFHDLDEETIERVLPSTIKKDDYDKGINCFELFLYSKGIMISEETSLLRKLNKLLSTILHPENREKEKILTSILTKFDLLDIYLNKEWDRLHYEILKIYLEILERVCNKIENIELQE